MLAASFLKSKVIISYVIGKIKRQIIMEHTEINIRLLILVIELNEAIDLFLR